MNYEMTENEFTRIESCTQQLDLMSSLCALILKSDNAVPIDGLGSFLFAQQEALGATLKAMQERMDAQLVLNRSAAATALVSKPATMAISADLLVRIMEVCSGAIREEKAIMELHGQIYEATVMQGEMEPWAAFDAALIRQGFDITTTVKNGGFQFTIKKAKPKKAALSQEPHKAPVRKRDRLVASA
ncbi:hypothetical protein [Acidovorax sp.]|uniref:hypothetical protein n=1 Tax=Acidovorax sp. TaxID=1872122 RepID=UPI0025BEDBD1|nr:hypothetical protein [Acidovorax sp.]